MASVEIDLLEATFSDAIDVEDISHRHISVGALRDFNKRLKEKGAALRAPVTLGNVKITYDPSQPSVRGLLSLSRTSLLQLFDLTKSQPQADNQLVRIVNIIESGESTELVGLLDDQIQIRRKDASELRRLMYVHYTAVQNAVDIVQSKRIDFLQKKDSWTDGVFGTLFLAVVFTLFPIEALVGQVLAGIAVRIARIFGARAGKLFVAARAPLLAEIRQLNTNLGVLRASAGRTRKALRDRALTSPGDIRALKAAGKGSTSKLSPASPQGIRERSAEFTKLRDELVGQARQSKLNERQAIDFFVKSASESEALNKARTIANATLQNTAFNNSAGIQSAFFGMSPAELASGAQGSAIPLDVAVKQQVQTLYSSMLFTAEEVIATLEQYRDACRLQTPDDEDRNALLQLIVPEPSGGDAVAADGTNDNQDAAGGPNIDVEDVQRLTTLATDAYEQLIWVLLFGNQVIETVPPIGEPKDRVYLPKEALPDATEKTASGFDDMLTYLQSRFYPGWSTDQIAQALRRTYREIDDTTSTGKASDSEHPVLNWNVFADQKAVLKVVQETRLQRGVTKAPDRSETPALR